MFTYQNVPLINTRTPNSAMHLNDFYLSYNDRDIGWYGCDTTAIVVGQMQLFLILNGDHRNPLSEVALSEGLQGCIDYFVDHINLANHASEHITMPAGLNLLGIKNVNRIRNAIHDL